MLPSRLDVDLRLAVLGEGKVLLTGKAYDDLGGSRVYLNLLHSPYSNPIYSDIRPCLQAPRVGEYSMIVLVRAEQRRGLQEVISKNKTPYS